jgi:hypothetical protein
LRVRRILATVLATLALATVVGSTAASAALPGKGLPPIGDKCAMQDYLGIENIRACEDDF